MPGYWRLSLVYACYFSVLGVFLPYWSVYLKALGFDAVDIGTLLALPQLTKIVAPSIWGWIADVTHNRWRVTLIGAVLSALTFTLGMNASSFTGMAALLLCWSFFWNALLAQYEAMTLTALGEQRHRYPHVRLWGSIGFIVVVLALGWLFEQGGIQHLPWLVAALLWLLCLAACFMPKPSAAAQTHRSTGVGELLKQPQIWLFFLCTFLMQVSHGPYYTFYTIYLQDQGYATPLISQLWVLGVVAEITIFLVLYRFLAGGRFLRIIQLSLAFTVLRWWLIGAFPDHLLVLVGAQLLHAASFASFHAACVSWVQVKFGESHAGIGQSLYSSLAMGAGWAVGAWASGLAWAAMAGASFYLAAALAAVALLLSFGLREANA